MKIPVIIHQQICQLRWHLLACLGLLMVLPIEEAIVNLRAGGGFYSAQMVAAAVTFSPLLAGLLACAIVQGDLDEKRYIFWRSKPANVKLLMALKFFVGLVASLLVLACPLVFAIVTIALFAKDRIERELMYSLPFLVLIAIMTYSLCFASNVLVRKTARAWLIGMLLAGFLLVLPFILPLNYRDFVTDVVWALSSYLAIILVASAAAFVFALYAAQHDWHLRTDLKAVLWVGAGLVFILLMLFRSEVANIKVLQEEEIERAPSWAGPLRLARVGDRLIFQEQSYVDIDKGRISLSPIRGESADEITHLPPAGGYESRAYPSPWYSGGLYKKVGNNLYSFAIFARGRRIDETYVYETVHLRSYRMTGQSWAPTAELDLSDSLTNSTNIPRFAVWFVNNAAVVFVNDNCTVVDVTNPGDMKQIDTKLGVLKRRPYLDRRKEFTVPIVPLEGIGTEERIRLSIDANHWFRYGWRDVYEDSIVDNHNGKIAFFCASGRDIARFDVTRWDQENIYCKFSTARPFTILENLVGKFCAQEAFVKNGSLYCHGPDTLLVFDVRSNRRIRKVGHFVRMSCEIDDIAALDDGRILLCVWQRWRNKDLGSRGRYRQKGYLYLLENPS